MQDLYVGDIGDFGKYGMLREINKSNLKLAVNWYKVFTQKQGKQNDGKYIDYLSLPDQYRHYDSLLFDFLHKLVVYENKRNINEIEKSHLIEADFYSESISENRVHWHQNALIQTINADIIFLDPDNGLETEQMHQKGSATKKHVKKIELKDYYDRGQSVILYQHRPQMVKKEDCIKNILDFNKNYIHSDSIYILEFPRYTNRFYFFFAHNSHSEVLKQLCDSMNTHWNGLCRQLNSDDGRY